MLPLLSALTRRWVCRPWLELELELKRGGGSSKQAAAAASKPRCSSARRSMGTGKQAEAFKRVVA